MRFCSYIKSINESLDAISQFDDGVKRMVICEAYVFPPDIGNAYEARQEVMVKEAWDERVKNLVGALLTNQGDPTAGVDPTTGRPLKRLFTDDSEIEEMVKTYEFMSSFENGYATMKKSLFGDGSKREILDIGSVQEMQQAIRNNGNSALLDSKRMEMIIRNNGKIVEAPMPTQLDYIRSGTGVVGRSRNFTAEEPIYAWYSHGLLSCTSVAAGGTMTKHSAIVGIYPISEQEFLNFIQSVVNGAPESSMVAARKKEIHGNKIFSYKVVDPNWKPQGFGNFDIDEETGEEKEIPETPRLIDIGNDQTNAAFVWLKEVAKLQQGDAYLQNDTAIGNFVKEDQKRFNNYWNAVLNNDALLDWASEKLGLDAETIMDALQTEVEGGVIYSDLLGGNPNDAIKKLSPTFAESLNYRPVDGLLNRFKNLKCYREMLVTGIEDEETTKYCVNHYPPPNSGWPESYIAPEIRATDKTLPASDRLKTLDLRTLAPQMKTFNASGGGSAKIG